MVLRVIIACLALVIAQPAAAQKHDGCTGEQVRVIEAALGGAKNLTLNAAVAVGDTPHYRQWFGEFSPVRGEKVRASLKSIVTAIRGGAVTVRCEVVADNGCAQDEYAWVYSDQPYLIRVCPPFFDLQTMAELRPGSPRSLNGTREGTIIHEISHFVHLAATEDHCYSRDVCAEMARNDTRRAIENADSYQYFAEDVAYFARQPITGKPPPAPRPER